MVYTHFQDFSKACERLLDDDITTEIMTDEELAIIRMYIDMLFQKFLMG